MNTQQAYINGFVKRAAEYGYSEEDALGLLKKADTQDPMQLSPAAGAAPTKQPYTIPTTKYSRPRQLTKQLEGLNNTLTPEVNKQLTSIPLSNITPQDKWKQGLREIMGKKPVFDVTSADFSNSNTPFGHVAPMPIDQALSHTGDIHTALGLWPVTNNKTTNPNHIELIRAHLKKYNPAWGYSSKNYPLPNPNTVDYDREAESFRHEVYTDKYQNLAKNVEEYDSKLRDLQRYQP